MNKTEILKQITRKYGIINGQKIYLYELKQISKNENIELNDLIFLFGCYSGILYKNDNNWTKVNYYKKRNNRQEIKLIKMDLKYLKKYGSRMYSLKEIKNICNKYDVSLESFATYIYKYKICYYENMYVIYNSPYGLWIGEDIFLSSEFFKNNYNIIESRIKAVANKMSNRYNCAWLKENMVNEAFNEVLKHGRIEKNLQFDKMMLIRKLIYRARYAMLSVIIKESKIIYDEYKIENIIDDYDDDAQSDVDFWLYPIEFTTIQKIIIDEIVKSSVLCYTRENIIKKIELCTNMPEKVIVDNMEQIKELLIEFNKIRICKNGEVIVINE